MRVLKNWVKKLKKSEVEDGNTQTPAIENITGTQSLRDTLTHMKESKNFFKLVEKDDRQVLWNKIPIKALGVNRITIKDQEYDKKPNIQKHFNDTNLTIKNMDHEDKSTVYDILKKTGIYSIKHTKGLKLARKRDASYNLSKK